MIDCNCLKKIGAVFIEKMRVFLIKLGGAMIRTVLMCCLVVSALLGASCSPENDDIDVASYPTSPHTLVMINGGKKNNNEVAKIKWIIVSQSNIKLEAGNRIKVDDYPVLTPKEDGVVYFFANNRIYEKKITMPAEEVINTLRRNLSEKYSIEKLILVKW